MANLLKAIGNGIWDSIESPYKVVENLVKGDFGDAWHDLKAIPGNQERANSEIFNAAGIRGWVGDHPGESVGAAIGTVLAAPYVAAGAQSLFGASGSTGLGASEFAKTPGKFGSMDFGGSAFPSFDGKAPTSTGGLGNYGGTNATGGWEQVTDWAKAAADNNATDWAGIMKSAGKAFEQMGKGEDAKLTGGHRPGFKGVQMPAQQYSAGAMQEQMAAQQWANAGAKPMMNFNAMLNQAR